MSGTFPNRYQVISLYRSLLRYSHQFRDYNFREYAARRTRNGFRENISSSGEMIADLYKFGFKQLEIVKRQATISRLFAEESSVMESK